MKFYTKEEVAKILRLKSVKTIENYIKQGKLKAKKIGGTERRTGKVLISKADLEEFIENS